MNKDSISQNEIARIREITNHQPIYNEDFPNCIVISDVRLPDGWNKITCSIMLNKVDQRWTAYIDSDLQADQPEYKKLLSPYDREGWCEVIVDDKQYNKLDDLVDYLDQKLNFGFKNEIPEGKIITAELGVIGKVITYQSDNKINFMYEYHGSSTIVTQEIYCSDGKLIRSLEVVEVSEGWHSQKWDGRDSSGKNVPNGIYFLKFRSAQAVGEVINVVLIHKNFEG